MIHLLSSIAIAASVVTAPVDSTDLRREELMAALKKGGYTVLLRHARTDRSYNEQRDPVPVERSAQRNLNDDGIRDAALMGVVFRKYGITFGEIIASPMFRTVETAEYAAGKPTNITMLLRQIPATPDQAALVMRAPKAGTNRLIVTHHFVIEIHVPGIKPGDVGESEAAVVRHTKDGKIELVGKILLDDWRALANPGQPAAAAPKSESAGGHGGGALAALGRAIHGAPDRAPGSTKAEIPDTHAGHIAREYITAFNTGSQEAMRAYIDAWMLADPARPTDVRLQSFAKLFADHGPLSVATVDSSEALVVTLGMKSKVGNFRLTVKASEAQPMRAASVTFTVLEHR